MNYLSLNIHKMGHFDFYFQMKSQQKKMKGFLFRRNWNKRNNNIFV